MINKENSKKLIGLLIISTMIFSIVMSNASFTYANSPIPQHYKAGEPYNKGEYLYSTLTITGSAIGREIVLSVKEIEKLSETDIGYEGHYSTMNSGGTLTTPKITGVDLYKLLLKLGMDENLPDTTPIKAIAKDGYSTGTITLDDIKNTEQYGYYPSKDDEEPEVTNLPVLVAYGYNGYPLVGPTGDEPYSKKFTAEEGYVEEADNSGGPLKLIFGQKHANDYNAPKNSKFLHKIIVGEDIDYTKHTDELKNAQLKVKVFKGQSEDTTKTFTVSEIEEIARQNPSKIERNYYPTAGDFYEGINIWYLLSEQVGLQGAEGKVYFYKNSSLVADVNMDYIRNPGEDYSTYYTTKDEVKLHWVKPAITYAKNGSPMTENDDGPLWAALPQNDEYLPEGVFSSCDEIHIYTTDDSLNHNTEPYDKWKNDTLKFIGSGIREDTTFTVAEIEQQLDLIRRGTYDEIQENDTVQSAEFIGLDLYGLLCKVGLEVSADQIHVKSKDGSEATFSLDEIKNSELNALLAYGKNDLPLVPTPEDPGYDESKQNSGGPLYLVFNQNATENKFLPQVTEIEVTASDESWKHHNPPYDEYLDRTLLRVTGSEVKAPKTFTLRQLEAMDAGIIRDSFASSGGSGNYEGILLKYLLEHVGLKDGINRPSKITVYAGPGFSAELSVEDVYKGIDSNYQPGQKRDIILAYAKDGYPLVPNREDNGYVESAENNFGPLRVIVENTISQWVKYADVIVVGEGEYEEPALNPDIPYEFNIKNAKIEEANGIKVTANIEQVSPIHPSAVIIFQLMKGNEPISIVALEKSTFSSDEKIMAHFPVESGNYAVKIFVYDKFTNDVNLMEESLTAPKTLNINH